MICNTTCIIWTVWEHCWLSAARNTVLVSFINKLFFRLNILYYYPQISEFCVLCLFLWLHKASYLNKQEFPIYLLLRSAFWLKNLLLMKKACNFSSKRVNLSKILAVFNTVLLKLIFIFIQPGVVACTCNPATLEAEFRNGVGSVPVGDNSPSIGGWIVWPPVIQH